MNTLNRLAMIAILSNAYANMAFAQLYYDDFSVSTGAWKKSSGSEQVINGKLEVKSVTTNTTGMTYLSGGELWKNYRVDAEVEFIKGKSVVFAARHQTFNN